MKYTVKEAANLLGLRESLVREYCNIGIFPNAYKERGTRWSIPMKDIKAFATGKLTAKGAYQSKYGLDIRKNPQNKWEVTLNRFVVCTCRTKKDAQELLDLIADKERKVKND